MTSRAEQIERTLTRPWVAATLIAAALVAVERVAEKVGLLVFWRDSSNDQGLWHALWTEWSIDLMFLVVGAAAGYALWRAAQAGITHEWPALVLKVLVVYIPARIVMYAVIGFIYALAHDRYFSIFGVHLLS